MTVWYDTVQFGATTDLITALVCLICLIFVTTARKQPEKFPPSTVGFIIFAVCQLLASLCAGIAHMMIHHFADDPYGIGTSWQAPNSGWLYWWLMAMISAPIAAAALICIALSYNSFSMYMAHAPLAVGFIISIIECVQILKDDLSQSGTVSLWWSVISTITAFIIVVCKPGGLYFFADTEDGRRWLQAGDGLMAVAYLIALFTSGPFKTMSLHALPKPLEQGFLHIAIAVGVIFVSKAVRMKAESDHEYISMKAVKEVFQPIKDAATKAEGNCRVCTREVC